MISNIRIPLRDKTILSPSIAAHAHIIFYLRKHGIFWGYRNCTLKDFCWGYNNIGIWKLGHMLLPQPYRWIWTELYGSLYYCLLKHCLKHCMFQAAIPMEVLKIICLYKVHVSLLLKIWRNINIVTIFIFDSWLRFIVPPFLGQFASEEIIYRSLHFTGSTQ